MGGQRTAECAPLPGTHRVDTNRGSGIGALCRSLGAGVTWGGSPTDTDEVLPPHKFESLGSPQVRYMPQKPARLASSRCNSGGQMKVSPVEGKTRNMALVPGSLGVPPRSPKTFAAK